jgi:predicted short-subunit dehydrogenase-like oxidoreductase (DUF2520 family)
LSLTGPIVRGDAGTVDDHIHALGDMRLHKQIYKALSLVALDMVRERKLLNQETIAELERVLEGIHE